MPEPLDYHPVNPPQSVDGRQIQVTGTNTGTANLLVTATSGTANVYDAVTVTLSNTSDADVIATLELGGTGVANERKIHLPPYGVRVACHAYRVRNSLDVKVYASTASVVNADVEVERIRDVEE